VVGFPTHRPWEKFGEPQDRIAEYHGTFNNGRLSGITFGFARNPVQSCAMTVELNHEPPPMTKLECFACRAASRRTRYRSPQFR
jgi:hypothetical protein